MTLLDATKCPASDSPNKRQSDQELRKRALALLQSEIDFIPNADFELECTGDAPVPSVVSLLSYAPDAKDVDLPPHLKRMCSGELLTPEEESLLFREMNRLKYHASAIRSGIDSDKADPGAIAQVESLLSQAQRIRDHLIKANMRLVVSIVKKFVTPQQSFDELLSEGVVVLMKAVEKFDFDRGFRFSTYAYRSIMRHVYRTVNVARKEEAKFTRDAEEWAFEGESAHASGSIADRALGKLRDHMSVMLDRLDRRERFIIRSRYALGSHRKVRTFQYLADKLGVSKERVRQLEARAVGKLKAFVEDLGADDPFEMSMVG